MKPRIEATHRLTQALRLSHQSRPAPPLDPYWAQDTMRRIRSLQAPTLGAAGQWFFGAFAWRLAPATAVLALMALAALMNFTLIADADLFRLFFAETQMLSLADF